MNSRIDSRFKSSQSSLLGLSAVVVPAIMLAAVATDAQARNWSRSGGFTGPRGHSVATAGQAQAAAGNRSATHSIEGGNGRGATRDVNRTYDPASHSVNRDVDTTTNDGRSWSHGSTVTNQGNGTVGRTSTATGPNGQSVTGSGTTTYAPGVITRSGAATGPAGQTAQHQSTTTYGSSAEAP